MPRVDLSGNNHRIVLCDVVLVGEGFAILGAISVGWP